MEGRASGAVTGGRLAPWLALARVLVRAAAPSALARAVPAYLVLGLAVTILFGGRGMSARDLLRAMATSPTARAAVWGGWLALSLPAARAVLQPPGVDALRALPAPRALFVTVLGALLVALEAPWGVLWARGAGPLAGLGALLAASGAAALLIERPRRTVELAAAATLGIAIALGASDALLLAAAVVAAPIAVMAAFVRAPERGARTRSARIAGPPAVALALAELAVLRRRDGAVLARGALVALATAAAIATAFRNGSVTEPHARAALALTAAPIPLALAVGGIGARVLETERRLEWLLRATATSAAARALAAATMTTLVGAATGLLAGAGAAALGGESAAKGARLAAFLGLEGAFVGAAAAAAARRAQRASGADGAVVFVGTLAAAGLATALASALGEASSWVLATAAIALVASTPRLLAARERTTEWATRFEVGP